MNIHLSRAQLLMEQRRFDLAEEQLRLALIEGSDSGIAHALLALCLLERKQFDEATTEARQSIHDSPNEGIGFYALAAIQREQNRLNDARQTITEALRIEPWNAEYFNVLAAIEAQSYRWNETLSAAEHGLECDPDHIGCNNLRAMALVKLGRKDEAGQSIEVTLSRNPEDAVTHANQGWTLLHQQRPLDAMKHFREALRLEPNLEWARLGIVEAMKARFFLYRWLLTWFLWLSRFPPNVQLILMLGLMFGQTLLREVLKAFPVLEPLAIPLALLYVLFVWMNWTASSLFNLVLRLDPFGRLVLNPRERLESTLVGICVAACLLVGSTSFLVDSRLAVFHWFAALLYLGLMIPLVATFQQAVSRQKVFGAYTAALAVAVLITTFHMLNFTWTLTSVSHDAEVTPEKVAEIKSMNETAMRWLGWSVNGIVISTWLGAGMSLAPNRR